VTHLHPAFLVSWSSSINKEAAARLWWRLLIMANINGVVHRDRNLNHGGQRRLRSQHFIVFIILVGTQRSNPKLA
jgi:hypothetical protein